MANSQPLALRLYRLGCVLGSPLAPKVLARRLSRGKEHPKRLPERLGMTNIARPKGPLVSSDCGRKISRCWSLRAR